MHCRVIPHFSCRSFTLALLLHGSQREVTMLYHCKAQNVLNVSIIAIKTGKVLRELRILAGFNGKPTNRTADRIRVLAPNATHDDMMQAVKGLQRDFNASSIVSDIAPSVEKILLSNG